MPRLLLDDVKEGDELPTLSYDVTATPMISGMSQATTATRTMAAPAPDARKLWRSCWDFVAIRVVAPKLPRVTSCSKSV